MRVHIALSYRNLTVIARDAASAEANRLLVVTDSKEEFLKHYKGTKEWDTATPVAGGWRLAAGGAAAGQKTTAANGEEDDDGQEDDEDEYLLRGIHASQNPPIFHCVLVHFMTYVFLGVHVGTRKKRRRTMMRSVRRRLTRREPS